MKIAITIENLSPHRGGAEVYTLWLVRRLMAAGHEVTVFAEKCGYPDVRFVPVPVRGIGRAWRTLSFACNACRLLETSRFDVTLDMGRSYGGKLHVTLNGCHPAAARANLRAEPNPVVRVLRAVSGVLSPKQWAFAFIERERVRRGTHIIAVSQFVAEDWRRCCGVPEDRIHVVYAGADITKFRPPSGREAGKVPQDPLIILCVAQNFRRKGVCYLIKAARLIAEKTSVTFRVRIVGLGYGSSPRYRRLAASLGVEQLVEFIGETDDMAKVYAAASVFCLPSFYDPCSLVVFEALAAGLPVVTTRYNGAGELITPGQEGLIINDPRDVSALADALLRCFDDSSRASMSAAARKLAERCTAEKNFEETLAVFERVSGEPR